MIKLLAQDNLEGMIKNSRQRTLELIDELDEGQLMGPKHPYVNPLLWEIGHIAFFYDYFILKKRFGRSSCLIKDAEKLYDSITIAHDDRWDLPLPSLKDTLKYMQIVQESVLDLLAANVLDRDVNFEYQFGVYHEDMHTEAFFWGRQILGYTSPVLNNLGWKNFRSDSGGYPGFADIPGGNFRLGASKDDDFYFDNEKWGHSRELKPFSIALAPVTNQEFAQFVEEDGYRYDEFWSHDGLEWRERFSRKQPGYWERGGSDGWLVKKFDKMVPISPFQPILHVNWFEANAYCAWAGYRLPTEVEWEAAALGVLDEHHTISFGKKNFPWGNSPPNPRLANLDGYLLGCADVADFPEGDSSFGCRQMIGNVWEWTADTFAPFPGFSPDSYDEYSAPLFGNTKILKGGAWTSRGRMIRGSYRNFFAPDRWDIFSGFRVCKTGER